MAEEEITKEKIPKVEKMISNEKTSSDTEFKLFNRPTRSIQTYYVHLILKRNMRITSHQKLL